MALGVVDGGALNLSSDRIANRISLQNERGEMQVKQVAHDKVNGPGHSAELRGHWANLTSMISLVPWPAAVASTISARHTTLRGVLRSPIKASSRARFERLE